VVAQSFPREGASVRNSVAETLGDGFYTETGPRGLLPAGRRPPANERPGHYLCPLQGVTPEETDGFATVQAMTTIEPAEDNTHIPT